MGCRHSRDVLEDPAVESIQYRKRSSLWRPSRNKKRKKSTKSTTSSANAKPGDGHPAVDNVTSSELHHITDKHVIESVNTEDNGYNLTSLSANATSSSPPLSSTNTTSATKTNAKISSSSTISSKNTNERPDAQQRHMMFSGDTTSVKNVLTLSVDNSDGLDAVVEASKHSTTSLFGRSSVFPVWESSFAEPCNCVNMDPSSQPPEDVNFRRASTSTTGSGKKQLCRRCSQTVENVQNNLRGLGGSLNKGNITNTGVVGGGGSGGGGGNAMTTDTTVVGDESVKNNNENGNNASENKNNQQLAAIANLLVLAALDLSAPASSLLVKNRKNAWVQLAGHPGAFAPAGPNTIWKKRIAKENYETLAYQALTDCTHSRTIMPAFYREVEFNGEYFIEMEDLLHHFNDPSIMDIKMGHRTFLEAEVKNPVLRKDLFEKMIKLDPHAPTEEEREQAAITKLRYMQFRENESSTANLGFRIEAIRMSGEQPNTNLKKVKTKEEVSFFIQTFTKGHESVIPTLWERLKDIRDKFEHIPFFQTHEIIGSSLLIMYDRSNHSGAWMIDFAKTIPVPDLILNHRSPWQLSNHEDGYLFGLDNLVDIFGDLVQQQNLTTTESEVKDIEESINTVDISQENS